MTTRMHRTQILLDPEQHRALSDLARQEGRSVSDLVREFVQVQLDQRDRASAMQQTRQLAALDRMDTHRQAIAKRIGAERLPDPAELIDQLRDERDAELAVDPHRR